MKFNFVAWAWTGLLISLSPAALSVNYELDTVHTQIQFGVSHMGFSTSQGSFSDFSGSFSYDPDAPGASSVEVVIQTDSLDMDDDTWNQHLSSDQWFNIAKYPTMSFKSTSVNQDGGNLRVSGELTLLGVTKPVVLDVSINKIGLQMGNPKAGFTASTTIDRTEWGLSTFAPAIGKDVTISIQVEAAPVDDRLEKVVAPTGVVLRAKDMIVFNVNELVTSSPVITQSGMLALTRMQKGGFSPHHNHPEEETITLIYGKIIAHTADGEILVEPGDVIDIEPYAEHQMEALEDSYFVEAFGPGRVVIKPKTD